MLKVRWEDIAFVNEGIVLIIPKSKTDQIGDGAHCKIPFGDKARCPVNALIDWRQASKLYKGYLFRRIFKTGNIIGKQPLSYRYFNTLIENLARDTGLLNADGYSTHSLRRGFATEASRLGATLPSIKKHGRWLSTKTVLEYIEEGRDFEDSAVNVLFKF